MIQVMLLPWRPYCVDIYRLKFGESLVVAVAESWRSDFEGSMPLVGVAPTLSAGALPASGE